MKTKTILLFLLVFFSLSAKGASKNLYIVEDTSANSPKLKSWRDPSTLYKSAKAKNLNIIGLDRLKASASAMPSVNGLLTIKNRITKASNGLAEDIYIVDLRQEPHGYLNNDAITLVGDHNWANRNRTATSALMAEKKWLQALSTETVLNNVLSSSQYKSNQLSAGKVVPVKEIISEKRAAINASLHYVRLMVTDHMQPGDVEVDTFVQLINNLPPNAWIHLHCRGGKGRTTTFMVMLDMLRNSSQVSFNDIIKRQAAVSPYYDMLDVHRKHIELTRFYEQRAQFIQQFYRFSQASIKDKTLTWSYWRYLKG